MTIIDSDEPMVGPLGPRMELVHSSMYWDVYAYESPDEDFITVEGVDYFQYYLVVSKVSDVVEYKTTGLIEAVYYAENCSRAWHRKPWEWADVTEVKLPLPPDTVN